MQVDTPARATTPEQEQHGVGGCTGLGGLGGPCREGPCRPGGAKREEPEGPGRPQAGEPGEPGTIKQEEEEASPAEYQET